MLEFGGEGLEQLHDQISQLSERQAANARRLVEEIEQRRREAREQDRNFAAPNAAQLLDKLQSANTPFFYYLSWSFSTPTPGTANLDMGVTNPDPVVAWPLFVHVFVGPANLSADVGQALALVDARFPRLTEPKFVGLILNPSDSAFLNFSIPVAANIAPSNYLGNCFLFRAEFFGAG